MAPGMSQKELRLLHRTHFEPKQRPADCCGHWSASVVHLTKPRAKGVGKPKVLTPKQTDKLEAWLEWREERKGKGTGGDGRGAEEGRGREGEERWNGFIEQLYNNYITTT